MSVQAENPLLSVQMPCCKGRGLWKWVCTNNPFYVMSAGLFLAGLWMSFGADTQTWELMSGIAGYTLLLAVTAFALGRFLHVWDDVRTVLLLVVLMFLATSVTFDEVLAVDVDLGLENRGIWCYAGGLVFAIMVSEMLLRGIRLALPAWFRLPYYLILSLFFLYPIALSPWFLESRNEETMWAVFSFSSLAGLAFLTLLPAIRLGPAYVANSPWPWPLYPWSLFGMLALAVPARAWLVCWSLHLLNLGDRKATIFGPYFLIPFGLALAVLVLEFGIVAHRKLTQWFALLIPLGLMVLARWGHQDGAMYQEFLRHFTERLGGDPVLVTLTAAAVFYFYASLRQVPLATEALSTALVILVVVGPDSLRQGTFAEPEPWPLLALALLQGGLAWRHRQSWRFILGGAALVGFSTLSLADESPLFRGIVAWHEALLLLLIAGALFRDSFGQAARVLGGVMALTACIAALAIPLDYRLDLPDWLHEAYPLAMTGLLTAYGVALRDRLFLLLAGLAFTAWLGFFAWLCYWFLGQHVIGLDYLLLSLVLFAVAVYVSVAKAGNMPLPHKNGAAS